MCYALHILRFSNRWRISISENRRLGTGFDCHGQISQNGRRKSTWNVPAKNVMIALKVLITPLTTDGHHYTLELQGSPFCGEQRN